MSDIDPAQQAKGDRLSMWAAVLRPAHWVKNLLLAVPVVFAHKPLSAELAADLAWGIAAMSLAASAGYVVNDLWDASFDRMHPHKRLRPIARGALRPAQGLAAALGLAAASLAVAASMLDAAVAWMIAAYLAATITYSAFIKRVAVADIVMLAGLHIWRLEIGGEISDVALSPWLLCFAAALFVALALSKRIDELASLTAGSVKIGRGYTGAHRRALLAAATLCAAAAVAISCIYIAYSTSAALNYRSPQWLWLSAAAFALWLVHLLRRSASGGIGGDPVLFAASDPASLALIATGSAAYLAAI